jgi:hypothetical protein
MKNTAHDRMKRGFDRMSDLNRKKTFKPVISRGKHLDMIDWTQLPIKSSEDLTDGEGRFWFIPGFSQVGGDDRIRP